MRHHYRLSTDEKKCKNCKHSGYVHGLANQYFKCKLMGISGSAATDIRLRNVCDLWEAEKEEGGK